MEKEKEVKPPLLPASFMEEVSNQITLTSLTKNDQGPQTSAHSIFSVVMHAHCYCRVYALRTNCFQQVAINDNE